MNCADRMKAFIATGISFDENEEIKPGDMYMALGNTNIHPLDKCDKVVGAIVSNYHVIVSKQSAPGTIGIFFPVECRMDYDISKITERKNAFIDLVMDTNKHNLRILQK